MKSSCLLVLDREETIDNLEKIVSVLHEEFDNSSIVVTTYEDSLIRKVRNLNLIGNFLYHILMWWKSIRYALTFIKNSDYETIICLNPLVGIFLGIFNFKKNKNIIFSGFLFEPKNKIYYLLRKKFVLLSLKNIKRVVVYSSNEVKYYSEIFKTNKFYFLSYGIDYSESLEYEGNLPEKFLFSGGGSNRDYTTLLNAYNLSNSDIPLYIATQPWRVDTDLLGNHSKILSDVVIETFGDVLKRSKCLLLSLKDVELSAGHMVMLQAMKLSIPIIVNDIPSVRDYVDDTFVTFYNSSDSVGLSKIIENIEVLKDELEEKAKKSKELYEKEYHSIHLLTRLVKLSKG